MKKNKPYFDTNDVNAKGEQLKIKYKALDELDMEVIEKIVKLTEWFDKRRKNK